jgi:acyl-CoA thioester hydrolase
MRFEIPDNKKLVHQMVIPIRWGDMDAMGHVNNTVYFRYLEIIRIEWFRAIAIPPDPQGEGALVVNAFCTFHKQLEYPGDIVARHYVGEVGRTSFETYSTLQRSDDPGVIYASGGATTVWVDFPKQKSAPLPRGLRALLESPPSG